MRSPRLSQILASYARHPTSRSDRGRAARGFVEDEGVALWRERIHQVLADGAIEMVFQPIVELASAERTGYEALSRFPAVENEGPDAWFRNAARVGVADELELLAVRSALSALDRLPAACYISINLSPTVLGNPRLLDLLDAVDAERVILELTEHAVVNDYEAFGAAVAPLRARGVRLAVDDAGAGYASLRHILNVRPSVIKLDISLTRHIQTDPARRALASGLQGFAHSLDAQVVAEGIEFDEELVALRDLGINLGQGYLLGRPAPLPCPTALT